MPNFARAVVLTRYVRTMCQCGEGVEVECVSDGSLGRALGLTDLPTESDALTALGVWEAAHECTPTTAELLALLGLDF
ncbi:hypothetical protein [Streptomyces scabiei]|uniref:hypothetical protein n=1 Tax=Streptomyces scabiei TaxID=1930 RepID=UPI0029BB2BBD|nr:hypothetical protein [Streptomyces scabiei]MDX3206096.1 hypothetical protein [Streptomyces scabiei]